MSEAPRRPPLPLPSAAPLEVPPGFTERLAGLGVTLGDAAVQKLAAYLGLLLAMNEHMNLTGIREADEAWSRHALDALALVPLLAEVPPGGRLLDVGSGGGVPGIPLAIARPDLAVTLLDATEKKIVFLNDAAAALALLNVEAVHGRAEQTRFAAAFDVVTARAVARLSTLLGWTAPFARPGGRLLLVKGERADAELREARGMLRRLHCKHERTVTTPTGRVVVLRVD